MPVVSRDVIWPLSQIRVLLQNSPNLHVRRLHRCSCRRADACSSGTVFVTVTVDRGRCADQLDRRRGYARPAVGSRPRSRENMVAVNADALVRLTRAVLPAISPTPLRYRLPLWSPTAATAIADRPARAIRHSDVLPYRRRQCTQYGWAAMGLRHLSWMISTVHDESRTIPGRRRCARPTSLFTAAKSAPAGATGEAFADAAKSRRLA